MTNLEDAVAEVIRLYLPTKSRGSRKIEAVKHIRRTYGCDLRTAMQAQSRTDDEPR